MSAPGFWGRFWNVICEYETLIRFALAVDVAILLLLLIALLGIRPGTPEYVIILVDFAILIPLLAVTGFALWRCSRHQPGKRF